MIKKYMNISKNSIVSIEYTLTDKDNQILDSSAGSEPLVYLHGHENLIPGLERALEGKVTGDTLQVTVPAVDAYGEQDDNLVTTVPMDRFEGADSIEEGMQFEAQTPDGYRVVTVTKIAGDEVTIDGNHPLAGQDLNFDVAVKDIREASEEEIAHGHPHHAHSHGEECDDEECGCGGCDDEGCEGCGH
jgi:FKBP-type peptidyl-prolyl cis-trans isomerase SlyD